jgi:LPS-assembly protein
MPKLETSIAHNADMPLRHRHYNVCDSEGLTTINHLTARRAFFTASAAIALTFATAFSSAAEEDKEKEKEKEELCGPVVTPLPAPPASSPDPESENIEVSSEGAEMSRNGDARLRGKVEIRQGTREINAEDVTYEAETRSFKVDGDVEYQDPVVRVRGESGSYDAVGGAHFRGAEFEIPSRPARGTADEIAVRPDGRVTLDEVEYTTCPVGNRDWALSASDIDLDTRSRNGSGENVRLDFKGVPILYTPFISFPLGDQRKSGFLFPDFSFSNRSGLELTVPYYFNLAPNYDLTATPRYFSDRGLDLESEFRYLGHDQQGSLFGTYLPNDKIRDRDRSFLRWTHVGDFAQQWRVDVDAANASDENYFEDFGLGSEGTSVTFLERNAQLRYFGNHWLLLGQLQNFQIIDETLPDEDRPYSRTPRLLARGTWQDGPLGIEYAFDGELVHFQREQALIGTRLDVAPEVRFPFRRAGFYVEPAAAYRYTRYDLDYAQPGQPTTPTREAPILSLDAGMAFERVSGDASEGLLTLEPRVLYLYVPFRDQADLPVFDTTIPDLNLVQLFRRNRYVGADRLSDADQVSYGVTSRLLDTDSGQQYLSATLGQTWYFDSPRVTLPDEFVEERNSSNIIAELALNAYRNWTVNFAYEWDPENTRGNKSQFALQYRAASDQVVNVGYRFRRNLIEQVDSSIAWPVFDRWKLFLGGVYSLRDEALIDQFAGFEYSSCCWRLRVVQRRFVSGRTGERDNSLALQLELKGLSNVGVPADAFLEGSIRGYSREP